MRAPGGEDAAGLFSKNQVGFTEALRLRTRVVIRVDMLTTGRGCGPSHVLGVVRRTHLHGGPGHVDEELGVLGGDGLAVGPFQFFIFR
jgi:hypothetical protein